MEPGSYGNLSPVKVATFVSAIVAGYFGGGLAHVAGWCPSLLVMGSCAVGIPPPVFHRRPPYCRIRSPLANLSHSLTHTHTDTLV